MTAAWLDGLLAGPAAPACETVADWWSRHRVRASSAARSPIEQAIAGGHAADRVAWAFASAYQAALRALVPGLPDDRICALCVTESGGTAPSAMQSTLVREGQGWRLDGSKQWTTLGPGAGLLLVAARDAALSSVERPAIRVACVAADAPGVTLLAMPQTAFVPEIPHARPTFEAVRLEAGALLDGDGYARYVKPFRTIEDLHVHAAVLAYLVRESRRFDWPHAWTERALSTLLAFAAIAALDPAAAATHLALAGAMAQGEVLVHEAEAWWMQAPDRAAAARWQRDRALLGLAAKPRQARTAKAWERIAQPPPSAA